MWDRRNLPLFIAICLSVLLHVLTIGGAYESRLGPSNLSLGPGLTGRDRPRREVTYTLSLADPTPPEPAKPDPAEPKKLDKPDKAEEAPKPEKPKKPEPPKPEKPKMEKYPEEMGEKTGTGIGSNKATGEQILQAREADEDQAFLSRDPAGPGRVGGPPSDWMHSPGENGHGGSPGLTVPPRQATANPPAAMALPTPRLPQAPPPQATPDQATPPAEVSEAVPPAAVAPTDGSEGPFEPARRPPAPTPKRIALALPRPDEPQPKPDLTVGPLVVAPRPAAAPPIPGDVNAKGAGDKGVRDDSLDKLPPAEKLAQDEPAAILPRPATRPSQTPGHREGSDGTAGPLQVAVPRIAPAKAPDANEAPAKPPLPAFALFLAPPAASVAPAPDLTDPTIRQPRDPQGPKAERKPAPDPAKPATPREAREAPRPAPPTPPRPAAPALAAPATPAAPPQVASAATGDGRRPGPARPAADPAQMSDSESDAFSKIGSAHFRDGRLDIQFGRKIRTTRPHIPVVGQIDSLTLRNPSVTLKVSIDDTGKVTEVAVHKSSGSNEIDTPCLEAMYDWWFEPLKDATGKPISDVILFTISFR